AETVAKNKNGWWYIKDGVVQFDTTSVVKRVDNSTWWYVEDGQVKFNYTGFADNTNGRWRIEKSQVNFKFEDISKDEDQWRYYSGGKWKTNAETVAKNINGWWYIKDGVVQFDTTSVVKRADNNTWWHVMDGKVQFGYTGIAERIDNNTFWYIEKGQVKFSYNGIVLGTAFGKYYYWRISGGKVIEEYDEIKGKTINLVNLRKGPGTSYNQVYDGKNPVCIPQNTTIDIDDISFVDSTPWYKTKYKQGEETFTGWASGKYVLALAADLCDETSTMSISAKGKVTGDSVNFRKGPSTGFAALKTLSKGTVISITGAQTAADGTVWYRAVAGGTVGYISKTYVSLTTSYDAAVDAAFEKKLDEQGFPESYRRLLRQLHEKYPGWNFVADKVSDSWGINVQAQYVFGSMLPSTWGGTKAVSIIAKSNSAAWKSMDPEAYDSSTGQWVTNWDGNNWAIASKAAVRYYLDPRNFINETDVFQFLDLSYNDTHTAACVTAAAGRIGAGWLGQVYTHDYSGPYNGKTLEYDGTTINYPQALAQAGKTAGMNPIALICIITQELGTESSATTGRPQICGKVSSYNKDYADLDGYYNYFNIGAYVGSFGGTSYSTAYGRGLRVAKDTYGWNTREKAINGGAKYFADKYVKVNQQTVYYKRFNVINGSNMHQFSTDIQGAHGEGTLLSKAYSESLRTGTSLTFRIPVYSDMPSAPCKMPVD
ncbi:MAG: SH3 domain-containing protein, partial [Lachnospiraceae bacterium]|nr:SH3 domain-containing protein [Lachnospiraceae bacterium]